MKPIEIIQVSKAYREVKAVQEISVKIQENVLFGLIGPDGAGKTTLFRMITTLLKPDSGTVSVFGYDSVSDYRTIRQFTGYMPGRFSLYPDLTVVENLTFYASIFNTTVKANYPIIKPVYSFLEPFKNRLANNLSGGMKQKLALCCALIHNPRLLVLDEPTTGVDAVSRKEFWETLHSLKGSGMRNLVSTPYMDEAVKCDRVALLQDGMIMSENIPEMILSEFSTPIFNVMSDDRLHSLNVLRSLRQVKRAYLFGQGVHVAVEGTSSEFGWLQNELQSAGLTAVKINPVKPDFEDCFIESVENNKQSRKIT